MMTNSERKFARDVLNLLSDMQDALNDTVSAMATEDLLLARVTLATLRLKTEQVINIITPEEK